MNPMADEMPRGWCAPGQMADTSHSSHHGGGVTAGAALDGMGSSGTMSSTGDACIGTGCGEQHTTPLVAGGGGPPSDALLPDKIEIPSADEFREMQRRALAAKREREEGEAASRVTPQQCPTDASNKSQAPPHEGQPQKKDGTESGRASPQEPTGTVDDVVDGWDSGAEGQADGASIPMQHQESPSADERPVMSRAEFEAMQREALMRKAQADGGCASPGQKRSRDREGQPESSHSDGDGKPEPDEDDSGGDLTAQGVAADAKRRRKRGGVRHRKSGRAAGPGADQ